MLPAFLIARAVVLAALLLARAMPSLRPEMGLLGWDADWYRRIADLGYLQLPAEAQRFFPLWPLLARLTGPAVGGSGVALLLLSNLAALAYLMLARALAVDLLASTSPGVVQTAAVRGPAGAAAAMPWVVALAPAGFVLVMGYTEALAGAAGCAAVLCARRRCWVGAMAAGFVAGALRPTGVLLTIPLLWEVMRHSGSGGRRAWAAAGPGLGLLAYLGYAAAMFGDALAPFRVQTQPDLRGGVLVDPASTAIRAVGAVLAGNWDRAPALVHLPWIVGSVALLVLGRRLLPAPYLLWGAAVVALALTARDYASFERYAGAALPLLLITAVLVGRSRHRRWVATGAGAALFVMSVVTFLGYYVP